MTQIKTVNEIEMEKRLDILGQALKQVAQERKEATDLAEDWKYTSNYYFDRYHSTRVELVKRRLDLKSVLATVDALLNEGKPEMPGSDKTDDRDVR